MLCDAPLRQKSVVLWLLWTAVASLPLIAAMPGLAKELTDAEKAQRRLDLAVPIKCAEILDRQWSAGLGDHDVQAYAGESAVQTRNDIRARLRGDCQSPHADQAVLTLVGGGNVLVYVDRSKYEAAARIAGEDGRSLRLYLNGFDQGSDAKLASTFRVDSKELIALRFAVKRGTENRALWTSLYKENGLRMSAPLLVGLGWSGVGLVSQGGDRGSRIAITDDASLATASLLIIGLLIGFLWVLRSTDALRDAPTNWYWAVAARLRRRLWIASKAAQRGGKRLTMEEARKAILDGFVPGFVYQTHLTRTYQEAADAALRFEALDSEHTTLAIAGLCITPKRWVPVRATYSLGRVQMATWFVFAVATSLFVWAVYGQLPILPASLVALLTLSAATAAASKATDLNAPEGRPYFVSTDFWHDLVTGFDTKQQLHRLQAIVVNVLLLSVGLFEVIGDLNMPTFEGSWLAFLGISGATLAIGKQLTENDPSTTDARPASGTAQTTAKPTAGAPTPLPPTVPAGKTL